MRQLLQPRTLNLAAVAAAISSLACYPHLSLWFERPAPVWYLEATIFLCSIMLWGFVFAWHTPYTRRPVFARKLDLAPFLAATVAGMAAMVIFHRWVDPSLRAHLPQEYPADWTHWLASVPFTLALNQLFIVFAPFDWAIRLCRKPWVAAGLTAVWGVSLLALKMNALPVSVSPPMLAVFLAARFVTGLLAAIFYLRGGVFLVWWWVLLLESRRLLDFSAGS